MTADHIHEICTEIHTRPERFHGRWPYAGPHCVECGDAMPEVAWRRSFGLPETLDDINAAAAGAVMAAAPALAQVWCDRCDQPAVREIRLTNGETAFRCDQHAWLLIAPKGAHV